MVATLTFCVSPGRCGTGYLAKVLQCTTDAVVRHEPEPRFHKVGEEAQFDRDVARQFWLDWKLPAINGQRYVETSHVLVNGFAAELLGLSVEIGLIAIKRNHRDVALSLWRRRSIPKRTRRGCQFLRHPDAPSLRKLPAKVPDWTGYQLCFWHCLEVEARQEWLETMCAQQGRPFYWLSFDDMFKQHAIATLSDALGLTMDWNKYQSRRDWRVNANPENYYKVSPSGDLDELEREVQAAVLGE